MSSIANVPADLRPRTVGEILDAAFMLYRRRFWTLLLLSTLLSLPSLFGAVLSATPTGQAQSSMIDLAFSMFDEVGKQDRGALQRQLETQRKIEEITTGDLLLYTAVASMLQGMARAAMFVAMGIAVWHAVSRSELPGVGALARASIARSPPAVVIQVAMAVGTVLASIVPFFICVWFVVLIGGAAFLAPGGAVAALERGPREMALRAWAGDSAGRRIAAWIPIQASATGYALARSFQLTATAWGIARGMLLVTVVYLMLTAVVSVVAGLAMGAGHLAGLSKSASFGVMWVAQHWAEAAFLPVAGAALALWYLDLRVRREGMDLRLALPAAPAARSAA